MPVELIPVINIFTDSLWIPGECWAFLKVEPLFLGVYLFTKKSFDVKKLLL